MKRWTTYGNYKIYQVLKRRCNSFLITNNKTNIVADTGLTSSFESLSNNIKKVHPKGSQVDYLFLTHTHFDHCHSAKRFKDKFNCQIDVSEKVQKSTTKGYARIPNGTLLSIKIIAKFGQLIGKRRYGYEPFEPDILVFS